MTTRHAMHARDTRRTDRRRGAFTLVEMLIVIAVIIVLLGILFVALNLAGRTAQSARTQTLMSSLGQALVRFKDDVGYLPPVLDDDRNPVALLGNDGLPGTSDDIKASTPGFRSITTLAEYLIGYGDGAADGYGYPPDESPTLGIRNPGPDGAWGSTYTGVRDTPVEGRVYGPYLELNDERLLGALRPDGTVAFPGEQGYSTTAPKTIVDYWGNSISYFRAPYPTGAINQSFLAGIDYNGDGSVRADDRPTLSDVFYLRPYSIDPGEAIDRAGRPDQTGNDTTTSRRLEASEFALFSAGPDRAFNAEYRVDSEAVNEDNIIEVGP